jgi:hypothetical protein
MIQFSRSEKGAVVDPDGYTPLHIASMNGQLDTIELLLEKGSDIEAQTCDGFTPLHIASMYRRLRAIELLLKNGANIDYEDNDGDTPLNCATMVDDLDAVKLLIDKGCDIESQNNYGRTPLHYASMCMNLEVVKYLLEHGADIGAEDEDGQTPVGLSTNIEIRTVFNEYEKATMILYEKATMIQCFFRVTMSKILVNRLRSEPENLFDPDFSNKRKRILKIDDSRFAFK